MCASFSRTWRTCWGWCVFSFLPNTFLPDAFLPTTLLLIDLAIGITLLEVMLLMAYHRRTGRGLPAPAYLPNVCAGLALMLALRASVSGAAWVWVAAALLLAGLAHATDMRRRWLQRG
jgi:hypothetical protein